jgi:Protein of unknown function (DUF3089)
MTAMAGRDATRRMAPALVACTLLAVAGLAGASAAHAKTVWLCFPGHRPDPCAPGLSTTAYTPTLKRIKVSHPRPVRHAAIDCFYVYPTVSGQPTGNANLHIDPVERSVALHQAARYSQYCRVFAPMYRQLTLAGIGEGTPTTKPNPTLAFADLQAAFRTYLRRYNHGRGFVLIGHSQGSFELEQLIARDVDPKPSVRRRLVSAILLGGNVFVKGGKDIGGDFKHIPACHSVTQLDCVIAFSTFDQPVPANSVFGRPVTIFGQPAPKGDVVLCTNPAALGGGSGVLDPIDASKPFFPGSVLAAAIKALGIPMPTPPTVWWTTPGAYRAHCSSANSAHVLQITPLDGAKTPVPSPTPQFGLHFLDANVALGNLVRIVKRESAAFVASGR